MNPPPLDILLAEDERSVAFSISFALKGDGHKVEIVNDGEEALARLILEPRAFDLLITDNNMPRMTGVELMRRLRDASFYGKILVLSAHLSAENRAAYEALGVDGIDSQAIRSSSIARCDQTDGGRQSCDPSGATRTNSAIALGSAKTAKDGVARGK